MQLAHEQSLRVIPGKLRCGGRRRLPEHDVGREEDEVLLVVSTNAVVYPRAVVVHPGDAVRADTAVVGSLRLEVAVAALTISVVRVRGILAGSHRHSTRRDDACNHTQSLSLTLSNTLLSLWQSGARFANPSTRLCHKFIIIDPHRIRKARPTRCGS